MCDPALCRVPSAYVVHTSTVRVGDRVEVVGFQFVPEGETGTIVRSVDENYLVKLDDQNAWVVVSREQLISERGRGLVGRRT